MKIVQKEDNRGKRTKKNLADALLSLMDTKSFDSISVIDICEEALVSRTTFYAHFQDKYELVAYIVKIISDEYKIMDGNLDEHHLKLFKAALKYNKFISHLSAFDPNSVQSTAKTELINIMFESAGQKNPSFSAKIVAIAMASASEGILQWWVGQNEHSDIEEFHNEVLRIFDWDYIKKTIQQNNS